jgi:phytoene dehydrogenase-like protein
MSTHHSNHLAGKHIAVVGGGLAGLAAAKVLADGGASLEVIELSDRLGGRVTSDVVDGFTVDRGFQVYLSAYPEGDRLLHLHDLDLKPFMPGAIVWDGARSATVAHPLREPLAALMGALKGVVPVRDALRMIPFARAAAHGPAGGPGTPTGRTVLEELEAAGVSRRTIDGFFRPFLGGVFLDRSLNTDSSRMKFLLRMFAEGFACVPAKGMHAIPEQLAASIPQGRLMLNARVVAVEGTHVKLESGETREADAVILATGAHQLARILPAFSDLARLHEIAWCSTLSAWFATPDPSLLPDWLVLNGSGRGAFNHGASGRGLFVANSAYLPHGIDTCRDVAEDMRRTLAEILGRRATDGWHLLALQRIRHAIPRQWPKDLSTHLPTALGPHVFIAGDHLEDSSINGALRSGRLAAAACLRCFA